MLSRGFYDAVSLWPAIAWPIIFSSCLFAYLRLCQMVGERQGFSPLGGRTVPERLLLWGLLPAAFGFQVLAHSYMLMVAGYPYVAVAIPIYIFGWILLPWLFEGFRPALTLLTLGHFLFAAAFVVLLGFLDVNVLRALNADLYSLLTGVPANI